MGCGSTRNSNAQLPNKKSAHLPVTLNLDPLTTIKIIQRGSLLANIVITSGPTESEQFPIFSSRLYCSDKYLTITLSNLKKFLAVNSKIFPKIAYSLKEKQDASAVIASTDDYHNRSTEGTELSNPEIKIVLPIHGVKPKLLMDLNVSIQDGKSSNLDEIKANFQFIINPNLTRDSTKSQPLATPCQKCQGFSLNGLNVTSLSVLKERDSEEEMKEPYILEYDKNLNLKLNVIGYKKSAGELVAPGMCITALNDQGEEIFFKQNLFPEDNEYHIEEVTEITSTIKVGGNKFKPLKDYWAFVRFWDNKGDGEVGIKIKYQGSNKTKSRVTVFEVKEETPGEFIVKCKGEYGFLKGNFFIYVRTGKETADLFSKNLEKSVQIDLEFDEGYMEKKKDIIETSDDSTNEKKRLFWRLVSVMPPI